MDRNTHRGSDRILLRVPDGMRDAMKHRAIDNRRSLNAELISLIELGLMAEKTTTGPQA